MGKDLLSQTFTFFADFKSTVKLLLWIFIYIIQASYNKLFKHCKCKAPWKISHENSLGGIHKSLAQ